LIGVARELYVDERLPDLEELDTVYALDSSTIDLCLSVFSWAPFRSTKAAVKLHTLLDLRGNIPSFIFIRDGKMHDVKIFDHLLPEPGAFYVMDRGPDLGHINRVLPERFSISRTCKVSPVQPGLSPVRRRTEGDKGDRSIAWSPQRPGICQAASSLRAATASKMDCCASFGCSKIARRSRRMRRRSVYI
jgi:hypothetical protein